MNYEDPDSIHNFIEWLDFYCEPDYKIGLFGSFFLIGICVGCVTIARAGDIYGRKRAFLISMTTQIVSCVLLLLIRSINFYYLLLFFLGWAFVGKQVSGYSMVLEMQPEKQ